MGIHNLELSKLLSPKPGMDLKRGVPGKEESANFEKHFEQSKMSNQKSADVKPDQTRSTADAPNAQHKEKASQDGISQDKRSETQSSTSKPIAKSKSQKVNAKAQINAQDNRNIAASDEADPSYAKLSDDEDLDTRIAEGAVVEDAQSAGQAEKDRVETDNAVQPQDTQIVAANLALPITLMPNIKVDAKVDSRVDAKVDSRPGKEGEKSGEPMSGPVAIDVVKLNPIQNSPIKVAAAQNVPLEEYKPHASETKNHEAKTDSNLPKDVQSMLDSLPEMSDKASDKLSDFRASSDFLNPSNPKLAELSTKENAPSFKSMVDRLFVESQFGDSASLSQPMPVSSEKTFDANPASNVTPVVRTQMVNDMKPLISHVLSTKTGGEMTFSLRPGELGLVRVELKMNSGDVRVAIHAEQADAKHLLQGQVHELKDQLVSAGLKVQEVAVHQMKTENASSSSQHGFQHSNRQQQQSQSSNRNARNEPSTEIFDDALSQNEGKQAA
jgi:flagellar hook-length control protein FliK